MSHRHAQCCSSVDTIVYCVHVTYYVITVPCVACSVCVCLVWGCVLCVRYMSISTKYLYKWIAVYIFVSCSSEPHVVDFLWMSVSVQSILVVNTSRPLHYTLTTDKEWSKWLVSIVLIWANMVQYNEDKVGVSRTMRRRGLELFVVIDVCVWKKCVLLYRR